MNRFFYFIGRKNFFEHVNQEVTFQIMTFLNEVTEKFVSQWFKYIYLLV